MSARKIIDNWTDIAAQLLKIGATAYGGPAIMGIMQAELRGIAPAVIGVLAVSLVRLAPYALPDLFAIATLMATVVVLMVWRVATLKTMLLGAILGIARSRLFSLPRAKAVLSTVTRA